MKDAIVNALPGALGLFEFAYVVPKGSHGAYREQIMLDARSVVRVPCTLCRIRRGQYIVEQQGKR
jgi:hypothetical protein